MKICPSLNAEKKIWNYEQDMPMLTYLLRTTFCVPSNILWSVLWSWFSTNKGQPNQSAAQNNIFSHWLLVYQLIESRLSGDQRVRSGPADPLDRTSVRTKGNIPEEREEES